MKRMMILLAMALVMMTGSAFAATTTLTVSAQIVAACQFDGAASDATFLPLDSALAPAASANGTVNVSCTNGTTLAVTDDSTGTLAAGLGGPGIPYAFTYLLGSDTGLGTGIGNSVAVNYQADIASGAYTNFAADTYSEVVTLTITP